MAERLFAQRGFAATSMRQIGQEAGLNVATLYYHCGSKEQLFVSIYARVVDRMASWFAETFEAGSDFRESVALMVDRVVAFLSEHPSIPRLLLRSDLGEMAAADESKREVYRPFLDNVIQLMEHMRQSGKIRDVDPASFITAATGVITYLSLNLAKTAGDEGIDPAALETAQAHARLFILGALGLDQDEPE